MLARRTTSALMASMLAVAGLAVGVAPTLALPVIQSFPDGSGACDGSGSNTLQDCIDSLDPSSTLILTSQILPDTSMSIGITKSLTLKGANQTLLPELSDITIDDGGDGSSIVVTVKDVVVKYLFQVRLTHGSDHQITVRRVQVGKGSTNTRGMFVWTKVPASIDIANSYIRSTDNQGADLDFDVDHPNGDVNLRAIGNRVTSTGNPEGGAGIELYMEGSGNVRADLDNNVIRDVAQCRCGAAAGIAILPHDQIQADVNIVGNTIEKSVTNGIQQRNDLTAGGHLSLDIFNNVLSHHPNGAVSLDAGTPGTVTVRAGYNDYYGNGSSGWDGFSRGTHNLAKDPKFVSRSYGDLHLRSSSPLIDAGVTCSPGGVANLDAAHNGRRHGRTVDIGAYERGAGAPTGQVYLGTSGPDSFYGTSGADILCGYGGNDLLQGNGGSDYIDGGSGDDQLYGGSGSDWLFGRSGNDKLCTNDGVARNDHAYGSTGSDRGRFNTGDVHTSVEHASSCVVPV